MKVDGRDVRITIDGEEFGELNAIDFREKIAATERSPTGVTTGRYAMQVTAKTLLELRELLDVLGVAAREEFDLDLNVARMSAVGGRGAPGMASMLTLARRAAYGGRKGRRAIQRMIEGRWGPTLVQIDPEGEEARGTYRWNVVPWSRT